MSILIRSPSLFRLSRPFLTFLTVHSFTINLSVSSSPSQTPSAILIHSLRIPYQKNDLLTPRLSFLSLSPPPPPLPSSISSSNHQKLSFVTHPTSLVINLRLLYPSKLSFALPSSSHRQTLTPPSPVTPEFRTSTLAVPPTGSLWIAPSAQITWEGEVLPSVES